MKIRLPEPRTRSYFVGKTGMGKSHLVKELLRTFGAKGVQIVALDVNDEYSRHGRPSSVRTLGPLRDRVTAAELARKPELLLEQRLSLAVVPDATPKQRARAFIMVSRMLRGADRRVLFLVDETGSVINSSLHPDCHKAAAELAVVATSGRHQSISLFIVAQRAAQIPPDVRSQASEWIVFRQDEVSDLDALAERLGKDFSQRTRALQLGQHLDWRDTN